MEKGTRDEKFANITINNDDNTANEAFDHSFWDVNEMRNWGNIGISSKQ